MYKGNPKVNGQERTKDHNDNDIWIHASGDEIERNIGNKNEQGSSNVSVVGDQDLMRSYSSKLRYDDEEYRSD